MSNESILEMAQSLYQLNIVMMAKLHAQEVINDALLVTLCKSIPPLAAAIDENVTALAVERKEVIEANLFAEFDRSIEGFHGSVALFRKRAGTDLLQTPG